MIHADGTPCIPRLLPTVMHFWKILARPGTVLLPLVMLSLLAAPASAQVERLDPRLDVLLDANASLERVVGDLDWSEGPIWRGSGEYLLFSDIPRNTIHRWKEGEGLSIFMRPAGYIGDDPAGHELGTNGLVFDAEDRLVMADHGNRQIARLDEATFTRTTLADRFEGRRLNSPNDLIIHSSGDIYFTDPPYGLRGLNDSPVRELDFNGVFRLTPDGELTVVTRELTFPNGIALSPDERTLYVAVSDPRNPVIMAYDLAADGSASGGRVFFDAAPVARQGRRGAPDGMTVDEHGNLWATGPGGVLILAPDGTHLGSILTGQATSNATFGGDGSVLYLTADMDIIRVQTRTRGIGIGGGR